MPVSRAALWTGIALGVFLATEAVLYGLVLPLSLGGLADAALTVVLIVALAVVLAELTRRHHRTVAGHVIRHGSRGAAATRRREVPRKGHGGSCSDAKGPSWYLHGSAPSRQRRGDVRI